MEKSFQSRERGFFVEYLPNEVFKCLSKEERSLYSKYRNRHLNYHKLQKEGEDIQSQIEELKVLLGEKKKEVKKYEREVFKYYDKVKHLDRNVEFLLWEEEEWRKKRSVKKTLKSNLKKEWFFVWSINLVGTG